MPEVETTAHTADRMKGLAFRFATVAAVSTGKDDYVQFNETHEFVAEGDAKTALIAEEYDQGLITEEERYSLTIAAWRSVDRKIADFLKAKLKDMDTSISVMVNSGARGDISNVKWASAMIGIVVDSNNREIELAIRSNYKDGLSSLEQFVATRGARKGLIDTALKTADAGYLTRRLVDAITLLSAGMISRSEGVNPGTSALVESTRKRSTPSSPKRAKVRRSVMRPSSGN